MTQSTIAVDQVDGQTRCLIARVRLMAIKAQVLAGGPARPEQLDRVIQPILGDLELPATSPAATAVAAGRPRPGRVADPRPSKKCCSCKEDDELIAGKCQIKDKKGRALRFRDILPREKKRR